MVARLILSSWDLPYLLKRAIAPQQEAELGGSWLSLAAAHAGGVFLTASILAPAQSASLLGVAYLLWFLSLIPLALQFWTLLQGYRADVPGAYSQIGPGF